MAINPFESRFPAGPYPSAEGTRSFIFPPTPIMGIPSCQPLTTYAIGNNTGLLYLRELLSKALSFT